MDLKNYTNFSSYIIEFNITADENATSTLSSTCRSKNIMLILKAILCVSAVVGNALIIASVCKFRQMRTIDNILICNLAVSSVFVSFHILTDIFNGMFDIVDLNLKLVCLAKTSDTVIVLTSSLINLLLMSIERYIAIVYPLRFRAIVTYRRIKIALVTCWTFYTVFSCLPMAGLNTFDMPDAGLFAISNPTGCNFHNILIKAYGKILLAVLFLGTTANLVLFLRVVVVIFKSHRNRKREGRTRTSSNKKTLTVVLTLCSFIMCWIPFVIRVAMKSSTANVMDLCIIASPYHIGILYSSFNWLIYGLMRPQYRRCFYAMFTCKPLQTFSIQANKESFSNTSSVMLRRTVV